MQHNNGIKGNGKKPPRLMSSGVTLKKGNKIDRKAIISEYKNTPRPMGVYQIKNRINGKVLIGSSKNLPGILNRFRSELKLSSCRNIALQEEWKQFGSDAFEFKELEVLKPLDNPAYDPSEDLKILEELWTEKLNPYDDKGYNKKPKPVT